MKNLKKMNVSEQIKYWQARGYWPVLQREGDGYVCIVSTQSSEGMTSCSVFSENLQVAKNHIGYNIREYGIFDTDGFKIIDVLHPSECMGNKLLEVGTEVVVVNGRDSDLDTGDTGIITKVDTSSSPYYVQREDGETDWLIKDQIKPYFSKESNEIQKAIEVLTKAGKIQDGKIINLS